MKESRISPRTVYAGVVLLVALLVGLYGVYQIRQVGLAFALALLAAIVLGGPVDFLAGRGVPRALGALAVVGVLAGAVVLFVLSVLPDLIGQITGLAQDLPEILRDDESWVNGALGFLGLDDEVRFDSDALADAGQRLLSGDVLSAVAGVGTTTVGLASLGFLVVFGAVFMVSGPGPLAEGLASLFPAARRGRVREMLHELYGAVQWWALGQLVAMAFIAVSSAAALYLIGVPYALLLGILGGLISFVPFVGPVVSAVPPILVALFTNPVDVVWVVVAYVIIQQIEGNIIEPVVMNRVLKLPPVVVLFSIALMGTLFGVVGVILAVPAAGVVRILISELWVRRMDDLGEDPDPPQEEKGDDPEGLAERALGALRFWR